MQQPPRIGTRKLVVAAAAFLIGVGVSSASARQQTRSYWVSSWAAAEIPLDPKDALPAGNDLTLRQLIRVTIGGRLIRLRISNAFGTAPLEIRGVRVARAKSPASPAIDPATDKAVTFNGAGAVEIPPGAEYMSDPVALSVSDLTTLAVSIHFAGLAQAQTGHPGSRATSYFAPGNQLADTILQDATKADRWYFLSGVDVEPERPSAAVAVVGDSIVDGHGVVSNTNSRWTDYLAERLKGRLSVLNVGIGGNCLAQNCVGPAAVARFGRDVLTRNGVRSVIILEGVNDLGVLTRDVPASPDQHRALVSRMITALAQIAARARDRGIRAIGATIMPYGGSGYYHPDAANEADRQAVNAWIRAPGHFDAVIDFDALIREPAHPNRLKQRFDSGDGLHPSAEGYRFMGEALSLSVLAPAEARQ